MNRRKKSQSEESTTDLVFMVRTINTITAITLTTADYDITMYTIMLVIVDVLAHVSVSHCGCVWKLKFQILHDWDSDQTHRKTFGIWRPTSLV